MGYGSPLATSSTFRDNINLKSLNELANGVPHTRIEGQRQMHEHALFLQQIYCVLKDRGQLHNLTIFVNFLFPFLFVVPSLLFQPLVLSTQILAMVGCTFHGRGPLGVCVVRTSCPNEINVPLPTLRWLCTPKQRTHPPHVITHVCRFLVFMHGPTKPISRMSPARTQTCVTEKSCQMTPECLRAVLGIVHQNDSYAIPLQPEFSHASKTALATVLLLIASLRPMNAVVV